MRPYSATVGDTDGNIIAAIITIQTPRNQPSEPSALHGPLSIPSISPATHHQPSAASPKSTTMRPSLARAASHARARPASPALWSRTAITCSGGPRELGGRQARLALVADAEGVDV